MTVELLVAHQLGSYPSLVGIHFNILELLRRTQTIAALAERVKEQGARLTARGKETVEAVMFVEQLCDRAKLQKPPRPQTYVDYQKWAESLAQQTLATVKTSVHESAAFYLGHSLGDLQLTLTLRAIVDDFRGVVPDDPFLGQQAAALEASEAKDRKDLELVALSPALPDATQELMKELSSIFAELASPTVDRARVFGRIEARRQDLARTFMASSPG